MTIAADVVGQGTVGRIRSLPCAGRVGRWRRFLAALWQLQHMAFTPDARSLSVGWLTEAGKRTGFEVDDVDNLIPAMTKLVVFAKPS